MAQRFNWAEIEAVCFASVVRSFGGFCTFFYFLNGHGPLPGADERAGSLSSILEDPARAFPTISYITGWKLKMGLDLAVPWLCLPSTRMSDWDNKDLGEEPKGTMSNRFACFNSCYKACFAQVLQSRLTFWPMSITSFGLLLDALEHV